MGVTKTNWKKARDHTVTLPSGTVVKIAIPNLPALVKAGVVPNELLEAAKKRVQPEDVTPDDIKAEADFNAYLVSKMIVEPTGIEPDDVPELPYEDVTMLVEFATRQRDVDAVGHQLGGLETVDEYRSFRAEQLGVAAALGLA